MTSLSDVQARLAGLIRQGRTLVGDGDAAAFVRKQIAGNDRLCPEEQLEIYREQFWLRHTSALLEDYPGLSGILGQKDWERLAEAYLETHPPSHFSLRELGAKLPRFLAEHPNSVPHPALCLDMARLEWAYVEVFDAVEESPPSIEELRALPEEAWATCKLEISSALRLLRFTYPVADLRRALKTSQPGQHIALPDMQPQPTAVYRRNRELFDTPLEDAGFRILERLSAGRPLLSAVDEVLTAAPGEAESIQSSLQQWFHEWTATGWIVGVEPVAV